MENKLSHITEDSFINDIGILHMRVQNLTWSHIRTTLRVDDLVASILNSRRNYIDYNIINWM